MAGAINTSLVAFNSTNAVTIASGVATVTPTYIVLSAESGTVDDLNTLTISSTVTALIGTNPVPLILKAASGHTITVKHGAGNIELNGSTDFVLSGNRKLILLHDGTTATDLSGNAPGGGTATPTQFSVVVGPSSHPDYLAFDYVTDGVADEVQLNQAFDAAASGGLLIIPNEYRTVDRVRFSSNTSVYWEGVTIKPTNSYAPTAETLGGLNIYSILTNKDHTGGNSGTTFRGNGRVTAEGVTGLPANTSGQPSTFGVWFHNCTDCRMDGCRVDNIIYTPTGTAAEISDVRQYGIATSSCRDITFFNVTVDHCGNDNISLRKDSSNITVESCKLEYSRYGHSGGQTATGVGLIFGGTQGGSKGNKWINNRVRGDRAINTFQQGGITSHGGWDELIQGNSIENCGDGVVVIGECRNVTVDANLIYDPVAYGIVILSSDSSEMKDIKITSNQITMITGGGAEYGIYLWATNMSMSGLSITGNTVVGSDGSSQRGIYLNGAGAVTITSVDVLGNPIRNCGTGIFADTTSASTTIGRLWIHNNPIHECTNSIRVVENAAAGTISNVDIRNNPITSTKNSGVGIELEGVTYSQVVDNRIAVTGTSAIPGQELTGAAFNEWIDNRTTLSTTTAITLIAGNGSILRSYKDGVLGINTNSPAATVGGADIASGGIGLVLGADSASTDRTNNTIKIARFAAAHYANSTAPALIAAYNCGAATNALLIGGGSTINTGATSISFYTNGVGSSDTSGGTLRMAIDSAGVVAIAGSLTIGTPLAVASGGTGINALGTGVATFLGTPSSANLLAAITDETGTGPLVFGTAPNFTGLVTIGGLTSQATNGGLDIASGGIGLVVGADSAATTRTNNTSKVGRFSIPHYANATAPALAVAMSNTNGANALLVGGGSTVNTGATSISFYTNGTSSTDLSGGTVRMSISSAGVVAISGSLTLGTVLAETYGGTGLSALGTGVGAFLGTPSSANLLAAITDETGTGALVFNNTPNFTGGFTVGGLTNASTNGGIDVASGGLGFIGGADASASTRTNATNKVFRTGCVHYTNSEEPVGSVVTTSTTSANTVAIGGGASTVNAATQLNFYTAATNTTVTGTVQLGIDSTGLATFSQGIKTAATSSGNSGTWKFGTLVSTAVVLDTTRHITLDIGGTTYKVLVST